MAFLGGDLPGGIPAFPEGWYHLAMSSELPPGGVLTRRVCGRDVVAFRAASGIVAAADAHCPHLGAHLGHGGCVVGEALRCPFHGLHWGTDGRCVGADDTASPGIRARLATWQVHELHGAVMIYYSATGAEPWWRLPELDMEGWTPVASETLRFPGHVLEVAENGVDRRHFLAVHGYTDVTEFDVRVEGPTMFSRFGFRKDGVEQIFDTRVHGLGYALTDLHIREPAIHARVILLSNQLDAETVDFTVCTSIEGEAPWQGAFLAAIVDDVRKDLPIWAHKKRLEHPSLIPSDGPIALYRQFARQFYPRP